MPSPDNGGVGAKIIKINRREIIFLENFFS
jgi:hypothetical protein